MHQSITLRARFAVQTLCPLTRIFADTETVLRSHTLDPSASGQMGRSLAPAAPPSGLDRDPLLLGLLLSMEVGGLEEGPPEGPGAVGRVDQPNMANGDVVGLVPLLGGWGDRSTSPSATPGVPPSADCAILPAPKPVQPSLKGRVSE